MATCFPLEVFSRGDRHTGLVSAKEQSVELLGSALGHSAAMGHSGQRSSPSPTREDLGFKWDKQAL